MNDRSAVVLVVAVIVVFVVFALAGFLVGEHQQVKLLSYELEVQKATSETGPCGTKFVVPGVGRDGKEVSVAGIITLPEQASRYFTKVVEVHDERGPYGIGGSTGRTNRYEEVWFREIEGGETFVLRRHEPIK